MAQKLSIPQLQQAIQDGTIPAYVGVPLLQDKVKQQKEAAAMAGQAKMPSVAEQVMNEASQVERGVPALPTNLPAAGMAGGGIVAFAEGGMYDDEDTSEDRIDSDRQQEINDLMDEYAQTFQGGIGSLPAAEEKEPRGKEDTTDFIARIMHKESRGKRYDKEGKLLTSEKGAQGEMQVMPGTSRDPGFGVKGARDDSPDELARVGRDYANVLLKRYGDPKIAAIAYNMGPGATDKWLAAGADPSKLPQETQGYARGFAQGGEVQHFAAGDLVFNPETGEMEKEVEREGLGTKFGRFINYGKGLEAGNDLPGMARAKAALEATLAARNGKPATQTTVAQAAPAAPAVVKQAAPTENAYTRGQDEQDVLAGKMETPSVTAKEETAPKADEFADIKDILKQRYSNIDKQREQDKYMAMLSAGLGMMSGTSPHAFANIGTGAQQGIQSLAQSNAARTAEENALLSGRLGLAKIGGAKEQADAMMQMRRDLQKDALAQRSEAAKATEAGRTEARENRIDAKQIDYIKSAKESALAQATKLVNSGTAAMTMTDDQKAEAVQNTANKLLMNDNLYRGYVKNQHGKDPFEGFGMGEDQLGAQMKSAFGSYEPSKYDYRMVDGRAQRKLKE
jgi:hypothetical protein